VVIGGGAVAERKVEGLLGGGAAVTVVSPTLTPRLTAWVREGRIAHREREYRPADLVGAQLAFVATEDGRVNELVAQDARAAGVWVNAADDPARCDFILPAVLRRGHLVVAVTTGGASPALARAIREELEAYFTEDYAVLAAIVAETRHQLGRGAHGLTAEAWRRALDADLRRLIAEGRRDEAKAHLWRRLGVTACA